MKILKKVINLRCSIGKLEFCAAKFRPLLIELTINMNRVINYQRVC